MSNHKQRAQIESIVRALVMLVSTGSVAALGFERIRREIVGRITVAMEKHVAGGGAKKHRGAQDDDDHFRYGMGGGGYKADKKYFEGTQCEGKSGADLRNCFFKRLTSKERQKILCDTMDDRDLSGTLVWSLPLMFFVTFLTVLIMGAIVDLVVNKVKPARDVMQDAAIRGALVATVTTTMYVALVKFKAPVQKRTVFIYTVLIGLAAVGVDSFVETVITPGGV